MDKIQFQERWNNALAYKNDLFKKLFYKKPLENGELRLERQQKQQRAQYYKQQRLKHKRTKEEQQRRAKEELARFTEEERRAFDEWERQNKERTVY